MGTVSGLISLLVTGRAAACLGQLASQPSMQMNSWYFVLTLGNMIIYNASFYTAHIIGISGVPHVIVVTAAVGQGFVTLTTCMLVSSVWVDEFIAACSELGRREAVSPADTEAMLARYDQLREGCGTVLFIMFTSIQLISIFSVFNILPGQVNFIKSVVGIVKQCLY